MRLVADTNIIISALLKEGASRKIILDNNFEIITPSYTLSEITKYRNEICERAGLSLFDFNILLEALFKRIKIINKEFYFEYLDNCCKLVEDINDIPFLALAISNNCPVWTEDKHFKKQNKVKILTTKDMLNLTK